MFQPIDRVAEFVKNMCISADRQDMICVSAYRQGGKVCQGHDVCFSL